jgi:metallophosphoesterase superfamily enzyme
MEIKIETTCEDIKRTTIAIANFCKDNFRQSKVIINGELKHSHDYRSEDEKR